jgi:hypothetical protein
MASKALAKPGRAWRHRDDRRRRVRDHDHGPTELKSAIQAATNGQRIDAFQLDMVKVPSGGITVWTIPDIIEGERIDKKIEGIVVLQRTIRSWWRTRVR